MITSVSPERAFLVGIEITQGNALWNVEESMSELGMLVRTAGAEVVSIFTQRLRKPTYYYVGTGKLNEIKNSISEAKCSLIVFNDELTPNQQRNLEKALEIKVIDRTALILDIFSRRALTREGQLQVELAQYRYLLPRLIGQWSHLERLGGGIGTRGPGETQLETDRRIIRRRIQKLEKDLNLVSDRRESYMARRKQARLPIVSLVGYTNAGKSTLFNTLSRAGVLTQDRLFSTLDPVTRRIRLPSGRQVLLTDTVGFIHKLPPTVVAAFKSTLEELNQADLLVHVVDITHTKAPEQAEIVSETLKDLGLDYKPTMLVLNKMDLVVPSESKEYSVTSPTFFPTNSVLVSASREWNLHNLLDIIEKELGSQDC